MGEVVEMRRKISVAVRRFGSSFELEYFAGRTPATSDPVAALKINGQAFGFVTIGFHDLDDWSEVSLDFSDDTPLLSPVDLGINPATEIPQDLLFLSNAEDYVLGLLNKGLADILASTAQIPEKEPEEPEEGPPVMSPTDRGTRAVNVWHNHGGQVEQLPNLIAIEIYDALDHMGDSLGALLDEEEVDREQCGAYIRTVVQEALVSWKHTEDLA